MPDLTDSGIRLRTVQQALTLVASAPLTGEDWCALDEGEVLAIQRGVSRRDCGRDVAAGDISRGRGVHERGFAPSGEV